MFRPPAYLLLALLLSGLAGCGTTRWTDTKRTATEQLLVSDAIDRAVSRIDFGLLAGKEVFLDVAYLGDAVDKEYLTSALRQQMVGNGCVLKDKRDLADFIIEARAGAVGTDRHDLLYGVPALSLPTFSSVPAGAPGLPTATPEVALAKRTDQQAVAKIAVFAYHRETGAPVWQSGADTVSSKARDLWVFGAGPFQEGSIYDHPRFAGDALHVPLADPNKPNGEPGPPVRVSQQRLFNLPHSFPPKPIAKTNSTGVFDDAIAGGGPTTGAVQPTAFNGAAPLNSLWEPLKLPVIGPAAANAK